MDNAMTIPKQRAEWDALLYGALPAMEHAYGTTRYIYRLREMGETLLTAVTALTSKIDEALALVRAPDSTNDGGAADIAEEIRSLLSIQRALGDDVDRATKRVAALEAEKAVLERAVARLGEERDQLLAWLHECHDAVSSSAWEEADAHAVAGLVQLRVDRVRIALKDSEAESDRLQAAWARVPHLGYDSCLGTPTVFDQQDCIVHSPDECARLGGKCASQ